jgi:hypothetical protein
MSKLKDYDQKIRTTANLERGHDNAPFIGMGGLLSCDYMEIKRRTPKVNDRERMVNFPLLSKKALTSNLNPSQFFKSLVFSDIISISKEKILNIDKFFMLNYDVIKIHNKETQWVLFV